MQKKLWVILLTVIVFLSGATLGISTVYRVDSVTLNTWLVSDEAKEAATLLQTQLEQEYEKDSIFFVNDKKAEEVVKAFPYFRISAFKKSYPNRLIIDVTENAEVYAIEVVEEEEYYILASDGTTLGRRNTHVNGLNGEENVILKGLNVTAVSGEVPKGDECFLSVLELCQELSLLFDGIRRNVVSVEVYTRAPEMIYRIVMREGVCVYIGNPTAFMKEKTLEAVNAYTGLSNEQKTRGQIVVSDNNGEIFTSYSEKDLFLN